MIGENGVEFSLEARDHVSPTLDAIRRHARSVQGTLNNFDNSANRSGDDLNNKTSKGTMGMLAFGAAAGAAAIAVGSIASAFTSAMSEGMKFQTMSRVVASDIQMNLGGTMRDNQKMLLSMQKTLAKDAAMLPGETKDYSTMLNAISESVSMANKGDASGFEKDVLDMSKRATILATVRGADINDSGSAMNRAIGGGQSIRELLNTIDIFAKSPVLKSGILKGIADAGLTTDDWMTITTKQRKDIVKAALQKATPDTLIKEFDSTTESLWQGIVSGIFDPLSGSLGVLRDVGSRNNRTVMTAAFDLLESFKEMTGGIGEVAEALGFVFDPMAAVIDVLDFVTGLFSSISYTIARAKESPGGLASFDLSDIAVGIADWLNGYIKEISDNLSSLDGNTVARVFWKGVLGTLDALTTFFKTLDFSAIGSGIGEFIGQIFWTVFNDENLPKFIGSVFNLIFAVSDALMGLATGLVKGLVNALIVKPIRSAADAFTKTVVDLFTWLMSPFKTVTDSVIAFIDAAKGMLNIPSNIVQGIASAPGNALNAAGDLLKGAGKGILDTIKSVTGVPSDGATTADPLKSDKSITPTPITPLTPRAAGAAGQPVAFAPVTTVHVADGSAPHPDLIRTIGEQLSRQYQEYKTRQLGSGFAA